MFALLFELLLFCNVFLLLEEAITFSKLNKMFSETQCSDNIGSILESRKHWTEMLK